jgi:NAD-dependent protein deacetylase/lipoamidase
VAAPDLSAHERVAAALLGAERVVALTGLRLGHPEEHDLTHERGEWARRASLEALLTDPASFWQFTYPTAVEIAARAPQPSHLAIARLQQAGLISALITQAVDHLHSAAGSTDVVEVHGNLLTARCSRCGEIYGLGEVKQAMDRAVDEVPRCTTPGCEFPLRPAGTLWGEPLIEDAVRRAWDLATSTDCFVVIDSDLRTVPMSLLPSVPLTRNVPLVMIGETTTQYDRYAHVLVREPSEPVITALADLIAP